MAPFTVLINFRTVQKFGVSKVLEMNTYMEQIFIILIKRDSKDICNVYVCGRLDLIFKLFHGFNNNVKSSTITFSIDKNNTCFMSSKSAYLISEGSLKDVTLKTGVMMLRIQL